MSKNQNKSKQQRRLAAIMFTDMVGYSALTQENESLAIELLEEHRQILRPLFTKHGGKEVETVGDAFFVEFKSTLDAVTCAIEIQKSLFDRNRRQTQDKKISLRIGLHVGDVIQVDKHVHGDGVNIAARLEPLSKPGGICLSEDVARQVQNKIDFQIKEIGAEKLKNIQSPIKIYHVNLPWEDRRTSKPKVLLKQLMKKRYIFAIAALILIFVSYLLLTDIRSTPEVDSADTRIAVLPFINISDNSQNDYFADGMTEEMISQLSKIRGLNVIARTSVMKYKNAILDIEELAKELNVGAILEGSVRKAANKTRIDVSLIDVNTQQHLWSQEYNREIKDIFAVQSDIALKVANQLRIQLIPEDIQQLEKIGTSNPEAHRLYLLGRFNLNRKSDSSIFKALDYFAGAIELDPKYALAHVGIADCYTLIKGGGYGSLPQDLVISRAKESVKKALEVDELLAEAYNALANINFRLEWNWNEAEKNFKKAIELKPGYSIVYEKYAFFLALMGRFEEAIPLMLHAHNLDPLSAAVITGLGRIYHFNKKDDKAIEMFNKVLAKEPDYVEALFGLGLSFYQKEMYDDAITQLKHAIELSNARPIIVASLGQVYAKIGRTDEAKKILQQLKIREEEEGISKFYQAMIDVCLGNVYSNMDIIYKAYEDRFGLLVYINVEPLLDPFRSEPWFNELVKKMNF